MSIPLLNTPPKTQNQRVVGYEVPNEENTQIYRLSFDSTKADVNDLIWAAYRQVFSEHLILESYRQIALESQLRNRAISVREFIRGLGKSEPYRQLVGDTNSNYRLVDITFKRLLGRASYGQDEQIAQSIVIATQGFHGFIDAVVDSEEYRQNFGDDIVPYQRRRFEGRPFNLVNPRYADYWRNQQFQLDGHSYYKVQTYQGAGPDRTAIRQGIPAIFLQMAQGLATPQLDTHRHVGRATSGAVKIPDTTSESVSVAIKPRATALPYRYIPSTSRV